jgi:predicted ArsR family transcriptional regulator
VITLADPIDLDALRIRHEFIALPDLHVSASAVADLLGVSERHARTALDALVTERFLQRTPDGQYVRAIGATS